MVKRHTERPLRHCADAVLVIDETGDVKKGTHTVGARRQYTGTAGRIENAQVAVYLVYAGCRGHAAVDRELYIARSWTCDPDRCRAAGLGEDTVFATKPELAARMIGRFLDAGHLVGRVAGDEDYTVAQYLRLRVQGQASPVDGSHAQRATTRRRRRTSAPSTTVVPHPCPPERQTAVNGGAAMPLSKASAAAFHQVSDMQLWQAPLIPKLRARVRCSSPAPRQRPGSQTGRCLLSRPPPGRAHPLPDPRRTPRHSEVLEYPSSSCSPRS
ncbi:transposase [Streptomyces sp. NA02950]|uniref:transposase n=1 Tax=Streptomyces sp. NA02950 TaxID=2742137 RepID=UPI0026DFE518|nr:transposase [Streptomyces sp. NA02950]